MDILHLIERLERVLNESRRLPLTASLLVDEDRIYNIIDQMRVAIPEAIKKAERTEAERERILAQAKEEGERIRELARQEAMEMVNREYVIQNAHAHADRIRERAQLDADKMMRSADEYSARVLAQLEQDMVRSLRVVQNGLNRLEQDLNQPNMAEIAAGQDMPTDAAEPVPVAAELDAEELVVVDSADLPQDN